VSQRLEFCLLGPLMVRRDGTTLPIQRGKQRAVLAALLLNAGRVVSVDEIAAILWGASPPPSAPVTIRNYVKRLRQVLGETGRVRLGTQRPGYRINLRPGELDVFQFEGLLAAARAAARSGSWPDAASQARQALTLWRGQPLADVGSEALALRELPRLAERRLQALEVRIDADLHLSRHADVIAELERLVADNPLREHLSALLMTALYRDGRQADAMAVYRRAHRMTVQELGSEPGPELQHLHQRILVADPALAEPERAAPPLPAQLPADVPRFIGRGAEIDRLRHVLQGEPGHGRIVAITGAGGLGKSALAVHVAHQIRNEFPDGQLFLELRGSHAQSLDGTDALARLLRHLGAADAATVRDQAELAAEYRTRIANRRLLIVLDDARDAAQVRPLLPGTPSCAVLVTSRNWLPDLQGSQLVVLEPLTEPEAAALFAEICGTDRVAAEPDATASVLAACAGLPLAVQIAASRLASRPGWDVATLADQLVDERQRLDGLRVGDLAVRTTFWISYSALLAAPGPDRGEAARAFRLLGLWPGADVSLPAAAALLGLPEGLAAGLLDKLVEIHLLLAPAPARYRFHDLIRVFAAERADADEAPASRQAAIRRLLLWYLHSADSAFSQLTRGVREHELKLVPAESAVVPLAFTGYNAAADWSDSERANLASAALLASRQSEHAICAQLATVAWPGYMRQPWEGWIDVLRAGIDSAASAEAHGDQAWLLNYLGIAWMFRGSNQQALACLEQALGLSQQARDKLCQAVITAHLAIACKELKQYDRALVYFEKAGLDLQLLGSRQAARIVMNLGMLYLEVGRPREGASRMEQALAAMRQLGDLSMESLAHSHLADAYRQLGCHDEALRAARTALQISQRVRDQYQESAALLMLGLVLAETGDTEQARTYLTKARTLAVRLGIPDAARAEAGLAVLGQAARSAGC
jgi:DNA-binding SARP family transcriptional activator